MSQERKGIAAVGTWIIDHIHVADVWPQEECLASISERSTGAGGLAYNVLVDLAKFQLDIPLEGIGFVGDDEDGRFIIDECDRYNIDRRNVQVTDRAPTSYTEVITVRSTGKRTFFHSRGANNLVTYETVPFDSIRARIVHLGYLLIMDGIDAPDQEYGTVAAKILHRLQTMGIRTSVDAVSEQSDRFLRVIPPALKFADYLILNEFEAGQTTGHKILDGDRLDAKALRDSAARLLEMGSARLVVIHMHLGAYALTREGAEYFQPSLELPEDYVKGTTGAGDAFCAGVLAGIHEGWDLEQALRLAAAAGAAALSHATTTGGVCSAKELGTFSEKFALRSVTL